MRNLQDFKSWLNEEESRKAGVDWEEVFTFFIGTLNKINQRYQTHKINDFVLFSGLFLPHNNSWNCWDYGKDKWPIWTAIWKWVEEKEQQEKAEARKNFFDWLTQNYEYADDCLLIWERLIDMFDILLFTEELKYREKSLTSESLNLVSEWKDKENELVSECLKIIAKYIRKEIERINNEYRYYYHKHYEYSEEVENFFKRLIDYISLVEKDNKIKGLEKNLTHQLSWKTKLKHLTLGGLIALGGQKTHSWYQGENNLTPSPTILQ